MGAASSSETVVPIYQLTLCMSMKRGIFSTKVKTSYLAEQVSPVYQEYIPGYIPGHMNFTLVFVFFFTHAR